MNSDIDFETLQRRVEQALDEAINQFDKVGNKEHFISMILSGELQKYTGTPIIGSNRSKFKWVLYANKLRKR